VQIFEIQQVLLNEVTKLARINLKHVDVKLGDSICERGENETVETGFENVRIFVLHSFLGYSTMLYLYAYTYTVM
jgi:hypothetical protein